MKSESVRVVESVEDLEQILNTCKTKGAAALEKGKRKREISIFLVPTLTQEMTKFLLSRVNLATHRQVKHYNVKRIVQFINDERYFNLGNPIVISFDGVNLDCRNRFGAYIITGYEPKDQMLVVLHNEQAARYLDVSRSPRNLKDALKFMFEITDLPERVTKGILYELSGFDVLRTDVVTQAQMINESQWLLPFANAMSTNLTRHENHGQLAGFVAGAVRCFKTEIAANNDVGKVWEYFTKVFQSQYKVIGPKNKEQSRPEEFQLTRMIRWARDRNPGDWKPELGPIPGGGISTVKVMADITIRCWNSYARQKRFDFDMPLTVRKGFSVTEALPSTWKSPFLKEPLAPPATAKDSN